MSFKIPDEWALFLKFFVVPDSQLCLSKSRFFSRSVSILGWSEGREFRSARSNLLFSLMSAPSSDKYWFEIMLCFMTSAADETGNNIHFGHLPWFSLDYWWSMLVDLARPVVVRASIYLIFVTSSLKILNWKSARYNLARLCLRNFGTECIPFSFTVEIDRKNTVKHWK